MELSINLSVKHDINSIGYYYNLKHDKHGNIISKYDDVNNNLDQR